MRLRNKKPIQKDNAPISPKILLYIEDDAANRAVARARLGARYQLLLAENDSQACELIQARGSEIDIYLVDIELKDSILNGLQIIERLRGHPALADFPSYARDLPQTTAPIIVVTAFGDTYDRGAILAAGADSLILKPVDFFQLERTITSAILSDVTGKK